MKEDIKFYTNFENIPNEIFKIEPVKTSVVQVSVVPQNFSFLIDSNKIYLLDKVYNIHYNYYHNMIMCYVKDCNIYSSLQNVLYEEEIAEIATKNFIPRDSVFDNIWIISYNGSPFDLTSSNIEVKLIDDYNDVDELPDTKYYDYIGIKRFSRYWYIETPTRYYGVFKISIYKTALEAALAYDYYTYKNNPKDPTNFSLGKYPKELLNRLGINTIDDIEDPKGDDKLMM